MSYKIIAFSGRMESGKSLVVDYIKNLREGWEEKKFAGKLKQIASLLTGVHVDKFEDRGFKKTSLDPEWAYRLGDSDYYRIMHVREFLQKLGTEAIRNGLHENAWINALWCDYKEGDKWLISDCRFKKEAESVKERGGIVVRLTRNSDKKSDHLSETNLDEYKFDYVIDNQGKTIEETKEMVLEFMDTYGL